MKKKKKRRRSLDEGSYICPSCGEQIVIPLDRSGGTEQEYVEDCPVCCNPNVIHLEFFGEGELPRGWRKRNDLIRLKQNVARIPGLAIAWVAARFFIYEVTDDNRRSSLEVGRSL